MKTEYSQKLTSPKWQKKRLEIMQRDNFRCAKCQNDSEQLEVHHLKYERKKEPWEYDNSDLITLCKTCHEFEHGIESTNEHFIIQKYILHLQSFLLKKITWDQEQNILRQIVWLQKKRKELLHG